MLAVALVPAPSRGASLEGWEDQPSLAGLVQRAAKKGQRLLLKVGTDWCAPCRQLTAALAKDTRSGARLRAYLKANYDAEVGEGLDVARRYNVVTFPTVLVLGADGKEIGRVSRVSQSSALFAALARLESGGETPEALESLLTKTPADAHLRLRLGEIWALRGQSEAASKHLDRVVASDPDNARGLAAQALLIKGKFLLLRSLNDHAAAIGTLTSLRQRFASSPAADQAVFPLARALHRSKRTDAARALLAGWAKSPAQLSTCAWFALSEGVEIAWGIEQARRAIAAQGSDAGHHEILARLLTRSGDLAAAAEAWAAAAAAAPDDPHYRQEAKRSRARADNASDRPH